MGRLHQYYHNQYMYNLAVTKSCIGERNEVGPRIVYFILVPSLHFHVIKKSYMQKSCEQDYVFHSFTTMHCQLCVNKKLNERHSQFPVNIRVELFSWHALAVEIGMSTYLRYDRTGQIYANLYKFYTHAQKSHLHH